MPDSSQPHEAPLVPLELLDSVIAYFNPRRVIVFGSVALGQASPDSDIDLLVIVDDDTPTEKVTLRAGYEARKSYHQPADVIPVREKIFPRNVRIAGTLSPAAALDGVVVYDRP
jgi:predicted nucleotidyltransferase